MQLGALVKIMFVRLRVRVHSRLDHVTPIVRALADKLLVACNRRKDLYFGSRDARFPNLLQSSDVVAPHELAGGRKDAGNANDPIALKQAPPDLAALSESNDVGGHDLPRKMNRRCACPQATSLSSETIFPIDRPQ